MTKGIRERLERERRYADAGVGSERPVDALVAVLDLADKWWERGWTAFADDLYEAIAEALNLTD